MITAYSVHPGHLKNTSIQVWVHSFGENEISTTFLFKLLRPNFKPDTFLILYLQWMESFFQRPIKKLEVDSIDVSVCCLTQCMENTWFRLQCAGVITPRSVRVCSVRARNSVMFCNRREIFHMFPADHRRSDL